MIDQENGKRTAFESHNREAVGAEGREVLEKAENNFGFIPNLIGNVIESPQNAKEYLALSTVFRETTFTDVERNLVFLAVSRERM